MSAPVDDRVRAIIAHVLLMGQNTYPSPQAFADALLQRLAYEGYVVERQPEPRPDAIVEE